MTKTTKKSSAKRKLIPAVGMLTTSAIMLSSATYAWFTMNKEVQVTGLSMSATSSDGLEISLGALTDGTIPTINAPGKDDYSWKRAIQFNDYYSGVGRLMPASSDSALSIFKIAEAGVYAGGHAVEDNTPITVAQKKDSATMKLKETVNDAPLTVLEDNETNTHKGYYIDVPMWIRSSTNATTEVYCTVTITDGNTPTTESDPAEDLMKAVRVAIIPTGNGANSTAIEGLTNEGSATSTWDTSADANTKTLLSGGKSTIFGLTDTTYHDKKVLKAAGDYSSAAGSEVMGTTTINTAANTLANNENFTRPSDNKDAAVTPATSVFTLLKADENDYAGVAFVARIWIEGESTYCEDATANQDWQVDFHFTTTAPTSGSGSLT
ncbi:MAG: hypothetical protein PUA84_00215 [Oscillospiraceae bacterium]|nr:hypothetical protein [Oscillospiraceae bacterium]